MTELSFLLDLLLNHRLQAKSKEAVRQRIAEIETNMSLPQAMRQNQRGVATNAFLEPLMPVTVEAGKAIADRQAAIQAAVNQKPMEVSTGANSRGPRKF